MVRDQVFGMNIRFGDVCIMGGKFEKCYKYGMPIQSGIKDNTLHLSFRQVNTTI